VDLATLRFKEKKIHFKNFVAICDGSPSAGFKTVVCNQNYTHYGCYVLISIERMQIFNKDNFTHLKAYNFQWNLKLQNRLL